MTSGGLARQEHKHAKDVVDEFIARFDESYKLLACYAALPLVLTPELLNYLRNQFLRGQVPWVAEVDLLLSDLCTPAGYEIYTMDPAVRAYLLQDMRENPQLGPARMAQVASLLIHYVRHLAQTDPFASSRELQAQQWAAMVYLDDRRDAAVQEISRAFSSSVVLAAGGAHARPLVDQDEMGRLSRLTQALAPGLEKHPELVEYALHVSRLLADPTGAEARRLYQSGQLGLHTRVGDVDLPPLEALLSYDERRVQPAVSRPAGRRWALLVGADEHADPAFPALRYCAADVLALEQSLLAFGYTVVTLHDRVAEERLLPTRRNVEAELDRVRQSLGPDDLLWVHFSCLGIRVDGQGWLVARDTHGATVSETALSLAEIERQMRASPAAHLFLTLDVRTAAATRVRPATQSPAEAGIRGEEAAPSRSPWPGVSSQHEEPATAPSQAQPRSGLFDRLRDAFSTESSAPSQPQYDWGGIRELLLEAFTLEELAGFCFERPRFRSIIYGLGQEPTLEDMVSAVVAYCQRPGLAEELLRAIKEVNPEVYARYALRVYKASRSRRI